MRLRPEASRTEPTPTLGLEVVAIAHTLWLAMIEVVASTLFPSNGTAAAVELTSPVGEEWSSHRSAMMKRAGEQGPIGGLEV